jgi:hypothetical protein
MCGGTACTSAGHELAAGNRHNRNSPSMPSCQEHEDAARRRRVDLRNRHLSQIGGDGNWSSSGSWLSTCWALWSEAGSLRSSAVRCCRTRSAVGRDCRPARCRPPGVWSPASRGRLGEYHLPDPAETVVLRIGRASPASPPLRLGHLAIGPHDQPHPHLARRDFHPARIRRRRPAPGRP